LAHGASQFWNESRQPLTSLAFIAPLLAIYEMGMVLKVPLAVRNGADAWMRYLLELLGFGQYFLLPLLTVGILLAWHHTTHHPWRVSTKVLYGMAVESLLLAICLRLLLQLQGTLLQSLGGTLGALPGDALVQDMLRCIRTAVGYLGAGIYEELLFRLILLSVISWGLRGVGISKGWSLFAAMTLSALLFSAAHNIGPSGEPLHWFSFLFRFIAGVFFAILFVYRGYGVAVGTHALYDILVGLLSGN
jgi:membrane protease YdiL (CAAX protease family)